MINGFGNTSYSDKKSVFLTGTWLSAIFIVFTKCPTLSISSLLCSGMALSRECLCACRACLF